MESDSEGESMTAAALPTYVDDTTAPIGDRLAAYEGYMAAYNAWRDRRCEWQEANGWPGGSFARAEEENRYFPDMPFDPEAL